MNQLQQNASYLNIKRWLKIGRHYYDYISAEEAYYQNVIIII